MASARKLDQDINGLVETLHRLVKSFRVSEGGNEVVRQDQKAFGELPEVLVERLVLTSQSLLTLIADLKRDALLSDFSSMNNLIDKRRAEHESSRQQHNTTIQEMLDLRFDQDKDLTTSAESNENEELRKLYLLAQEAPH